MKKLLTFLLVAACCSGASVLSVGFTDGVFQVTPGTELIVLGSIGNLTGSNLFINADSVTLNGFASGLVDDSPFLTNAPFFLTPQGTPGGIAGAFQFLTISIPVDQAEGLYSGVFTVIGGSDGAAQDTLGAAELNVNVQVVPEPSSLWLAIAGAALVCVRGAIRVLIRSNRCSPGGSATH